MIGIWRRLKDACFADAVFCVTHIQTGRHHVGIRTITVIFLKVVCFLNYQRHTSTTVCAVRIGQNSIRDATCFTRVIHDTAPAYAIKLVHCSNVQNEKNATDRKLFVSHEAHAVTIAEAGNFDFNRAKHRQKVANDSRYLLLNNVHSFRHIRIRDEVIDFFRTPKSL